MCYGSVTCLKRFRYHQTNRLLFNWIKYIHHNLFLSHTFRKSLKWKYGNQKRPQQRGFSIWLHIARSWFTYIMQCCQNDTGKSWRRILMAGVGPLDSGHNGWTWSQLSNHQRIFQILQFRSEVRAIFIISSYQYNFQSTLIKIYQFDCYLGWYFL